MIKDIGSFRDFISSKESLMRAADNPPICTREYTVCKYVRLPVVEGDVRKEISLKPKDVVKVKWLYESAENPIALRIEFEGAQIRSNFSGKKLHSWLEKYSN